MKLIIYISRSIRNEIFKIGFSDCPLLSICSGPQYLLHTQHALSGPSHLLFQHLRSQLQYFFEFGTAHLPEQVVQNEGQVLYHTFPGALALLVAPRPRFTNGQQLGLPVAEVADQQVFRHYASIVLSLKFPFVEFHQLNSDYFPLRIRNCILELPIDQFSKLVTTYSRTNDFKFSLLSLLSLFPFPYLGESPGVSLVSSGGDLAQETSAVALLFLNSFI